MRGKPAPKRTIPSDVKYGKQNIAKFINYLMQSGKKSVAQGVVYGALETVGQKSKRPELEVFEEAIKNVTPQMEVRSRRVGGSNYQVPMPVRGERQRYLAYRWLINAARARKGRSMIEKLTDEIIDAAQGLGDAVKKKQDVHRMADSNKAFAHFARR